jgi:hypothetical protein
LARYEFSKDEGFENDFLIKKVGVDGSLSLDIKVGQHFDKLQVIDCWYLE